MLIGRGVDLQVSWNCWEFGLTWVRITEVPLYFSPHAPFIIINKSFIPRNVTTTYSRATLHFPRKMTRDKCVKRSSGSDNRDVSAHAEYLMCTRPVNRCMRFPQKSHKLRCCIFLEVKLLSTSQGLRY
jgi:hypothetical protein